MGHARVLSKLESEEKMLEYAQMIVNNKIPVREIRRNEQLKMSVKIK